MKKHFLLLLMAFMSMTAWAQLDISGATVQFDGPGLFTYNGSAQAILIKVRMPNASEDINASKYDVVYYAADGTTSVTAANVKNAGDYFVAAKGKESEGYTGETAKVAFTINRLLMSNSAITVTPTPTVADASFSYDGTEKKFTSVAVKFGETVLVENTDYTISYKDNILAGTNTAKLVVTGKGNFQGDNETKFSITAANLPATTVAGAYTFTALTTNPVYTGVETATLPKLVVKDGEKTLVEGTDYEIRWFDATGVLSKTVAGKTVYTKPVNAGTFTAKVFGKGGYAEGGEGITGTTPAWTLTIEKAPITVTPKDIEVEYNGANQANQSAKVKADGLEFSGIVTADAAKAEAIKNDIDYSKVKAGYGTASGYGEAIIPGTYEMIVNPSTVKMKTSPAEAQSNNYKIGNFNTATLTITKKELKLQAANATKKVGEADPEFTLTTTATGISTDEIKGVTITRENKSEEVGEYALTPSWSAAKVERTSGTKVTDVTDYYKFALADSKGKLKIEKGGILVTIKDAEKFYGQADPEKFEYTVAGLQDGDELPAFTISRSEGEEVGTYSLTATVTNPKPEKYSTLNVSNGIFTIKKAHLTITLPAQNLKKNDLATALKKDDIDVKGINNSDVAADLYTLAFNETSDGADGLIPTTDLTGGKAINVDNATYAKGYKLELKAAVAPATKGARDRYDILIAFDATTETATYASEITGKIIVGAGTGGGTALLELNDAATNNLTLIKGAVGETRTVKIALNRAQTIGGAEHNWKKGIWNCMVLPFKTSARQISKALGYAIVNVVNPSETTEGNVKFRLEMLEEIPANTPFFVKTDADLSALNAGTSDAGKAVFENVKIEAPESAYPSVLASSEALGYKFVGAYTKKTITGNNEEHLRWRLGDNNAWNKIGNGSTATWDIVPFNAYMDLGATAGAREIVFTFEEIDGTTTSIRSIDIDNVGNAKVSANGWYTLGGVKLNGAPTQKGVYIQDGKKVVIK